jgi:hypothetical protein
LKVEEESFTKASAKGAGASLNANDVFAISELVPMLGPLPGNRGDGVCSRAEVPSLREPLSVSPFMNARRGGGIAVKGALYSSGMMRAPFSPVETRDESQFTLLLNRRLGEGTRWLSAERGGWLNGGGK